MTECICNWNVYFLFVHNFNVNHMFLVDTYKWLLVGFQCKFLSIQEVVELFHSPDSS